MIYVSYEQLAKDVIAWSSTLPQDLDAVVGIPRSGMLPANILALHRNVAYADIQTFCDGRFFRGGWRDRHSDVRKVLVVDDSILSGRSMVQAKDQLAHLDHLFKIVYGAVYCKPGRESPAWFHYRSLATPRIFEWNVFHGYWIQKACVDIDGVLCRDPTSAENDDGPKYLRFIRDVLPYYRPSVKIHTIVTSRLEKYRPQTEAWLHRWSVEYQNLVMHPAKSKRQRMASGDHALRKAATYQATKCELFIESSMGQAMEINRITKQPVLCTDVGKLYA